MELTRRDPRTTPGPATKELRALAEQAVQETARTRRLVYSAAAVYAFLFAATAVVAYLAFQGQRLDLGDMVQAVWATAHGHVLRVTTPTGREMIRLGSHVDPFLVLFAPLWWIWPSPLLLLVVQALAVASGALPVYWLARRHLGNEQAAAHFALAYLLFPATQFNAFTIGAGPHAVSFAIPLILYAIWFLDSDRLLPFALVALLAASTKEEIPVAVGCLGIWYAVRRGRRAAGIAIFALGLAGTLVDFLVVIPHFSPTGVSPFAGRYAEVGGTPRGMLHTLATDPLAFATAAATWHKLLFLGLLFVPFLGLWALEPLLLLGAVPDLVVNLLSSKPEQTTVAFQYTAGIVPFVLAASILGTAKQRHHPGRVSLYALAVVCLLAVYSPVTAAIPDLARARPGDPVRAAKAHAVALVPSGAPVSATNRLGGYVSARRFVAVFPHVRSARWILVDRGDTTNSDRTGTVLRRALRAIEASPRWRVVYSSHGIEVLHKRGG